MIWFPRQGSLKMTFRRPHVPLLERDIAKQLKSLPLMSKPVLKLARSLLREIKPPVGKGR
jgi:hypothetical protein